MPLPTCGGTSPYALKQLCLANTRMLQSLLTAEQACAASVNKIAEATIKSNEKTEVVLDKIKLKAIDIKKENLEKERFSLSDLFYLIGVLIIGASAWFLVITRLCVSVL